MRTDLNKNDLAKEGGAKVFVRDVLVTAVILLFGYSGYIAKPKEIL